jgi:23S rRNA (pseudouridine1915-N3)-methyltransferase
MVNRTFPGKTATIEPKYRVFSPDDNGGKFNRFLLKASLKYTEMKITLLLTGKTEEGWIKTGFEQYLKRLGHYCTLEVIEIPALKQAGKLSVAEQNKAEGELQLAKIASSDRLVLMDEKGKEFSSTGMAGWIGKQQSAGHKRMVFLIGGPFGFSDKVYERANERISLSQMTFSHQMVRVILAEQLYRAYSIIKGEKYHHS